jgi:hypothetical protein
MSVPAGCMAAGSILGILSPAINRQSSFFLKAENLENFLVSKFLRWYHSMLERGKVLGWAPISGTNSTIE